MIAQVIPFTVIAGGKKARRVRKVSDLARKTQQLERMDPNAAVIVEDMLDALIRDALIRGDAD